MAEDNIKEKLNLPKEQVDLTEHAWQPEEVEEPKVSDQVEQVEGQSSMASESASEMAVEEVPETPDFRIRSEIKPEEVSQVELIPQEKVAPVPPVETELQNTVLGHEQVEQAKRATLTNLINEHGIAKGSESKLLDAALDYGQNEERKLE